MPILFIMYTPVLARLIEHHGLSPHQVYCRCSPDGTGDLAAWVSVCSDDVLRWIQQAPAKHGQDRTYLVCDFEAAPLTSVYFNQAWIRDPIANILSAISVSTSTLTCHCGRLTFSGRGLLCCTKADLQCSSVSANHYARDPGYVSRINSA